MVSGGGLLAHYYPPEVHSRFTFRFTCSENTTVFMSVPEKRLELLSIKAMLSVNVASNRDILV